MREWANVKVRVQGQKTDDYTRRRYAGKDLKMDSYSEAARELMVLVAVRSYVGPLALGSHKEGLEVRYE